MQNRSYNSVRRNRLILSIKYVYIYTYDVIHLYTFTGSRNSMDPHVFVCIISLLKTADITDGGNGLLAARDLEIVARLLVQSLSSMAPFCSGLLACIGLVFGILANILRTKSNATTGNQRIRILPALRVFAMKMPGCRSVSLALSATPRQSHRFVKTGRQISFFFWIPF